ncbi:MAG: sugar ABC transporter permease [Phycisphaerales bacterium]|nr:sugar ABC transporter permease [Phycisphaerales bacterium]
MIGSARKRLLIALAFLLPNLLGFLVFTAGPVLFSLAMSFTDWALTKHNSFSSTPVRFVGIENYARLLWGDESGFFWNYFGNTVYLMIGIPIGIAGSLGLALLLNAKSSPAGRGSKAWGVGVALAVTAISCFGVWMLTTPGPAPTELTAVKSGEIGLTDLTVFQVDRARSNAAVLAMAVLGAVVAGGMAFGSAFFRTLFYLPSLLAGVAMFLLWKTLYRPRGGLINAGLEPLLNWITHATKQTPEWVWKAGAAGVFGLVAMLAGLTVVNGVRNLGSGVAGAAALFGRVAWAATLLAAGWGVAIVLWRVHGWAADGLKPPDWLIDPTYAKPALIVMGVWCGVGGGNMLLYLAGLSNVPPELYEAASIDGASGWQRFKHVTWPQLAPTTFFIVIMSTIGGLQGGFEQAMVMTGGAAETRVLAFYLYERAFKGTFELGLASAIAWVMFAMIFAMTIVNFRLGSQMTND